MKKGILSTIVLTFFIMGLATHAQATKIVAKSISRTFTGNTEEHFENIDFKFIKRLCCIRTKSNY